MGLRSFLSLQEVAGWLGVLPGRRRCWSWKMLELGHDGGKELFKCVRNVHSDIIYSSLNLFPELVSAGTRLISENVQWSRTLVGS